MRRVKAERLGNIANNRRKKSKEKIAFAEWKEAIKPLNSTEGLILRCCWQSLNFCPPSQTG